MGEVMSCHLSLVRGGSLERPSHRTWQRDNELGAHTLTIAAGHSIDAPALCRRRFQPGRRRCLHPRPGNGWRTDTGNRVEVTSPDNILVSGRLRNGGVALGPRRQQPLGRQRPCEWKSTAAREPLVAASEDSPQLADVAIQGVQGRGALQPLEIPARFTLCAGGDASRRTLQRGRRCTTSSVRPSAPARTANPTLTRR